ncbi:MAG: GBS Bsp-like repeat-containing protein, partial [Clostridiales Family XIII bacterium]|nr:GBS Bsp-like repeat-containing protein [Clostridiales Family XIII bacterium]
MNSFTMHGRSTARIRSRILSVLLIAALTLTTVFSFGMTDSYRVESTAPAEVATSPEEPAVNAEEPDAEAEFGESPESDVPSLNTTAATDAVTPVAEEPSDEAVSALAATSTVDITGEVEDIVITVSGGNVIAKRQNTAQEIASATVATGLMLTGTNTNHIFIVSGAGTFNLTLNNLNLSLSDSGKSAPIYIDGASTVNLKLAGTSALTNANDANAVIEVNNASNNLNISGTGRLTVTNTGNNGAGIGSGKEGAAGNITILSGTVAASVKSSSSYAYGAGIGSGESATVGDITISGGTVTASANLSSSHGSRGAGIGSGGNGAAGNITISGGKVTASSSTTGASSSCYGAGIGSGDSGEVGDIAISGGTVTASAGQHGYGAGIGAGSTYETYNGSSTVGNITISGGTVTASATYGAGIGSGYGWSNSNSVVGNITISDVTVTASATNGSGIGSGSNGEAGDISISDATITASATNGSGIGSGFNGEVGDITISGGTVTVSTSRDGAGIGSGYNGETRDITISGGTVTVSTGQYGAGIGSGYNGETGDITISGGTVTVSTGQYGYGSGIGSGYLGEAGDITISGGTIAASATRGAGIGSGYYDSIVGNITIKGNAQVQAISHSGGAGIGTGYNSDLNGNIIISASTVYAYAYIDYAYNDGAAGIGTGKNGTVTGDIIISGGNVYAYTDSSSAARIGNGVGGTIGGNILITLPVRVSFDATGGSPAPAARMLYYDDVYGTIANATRSGYVFDGWYTAASGGTKVQSTTKMLETGAHMLYAHWTPTSHTVTFDSNGGNAVANKSVKQGTAVGTLPTPTRSGHTFDGWYTAKSGGSKISSNTIVSANVTYYAHWTLTAFTASDLTVTRQNDGTYKATLTGVVAPSGVSKVQIAVWSKANQSDLRWYTATGSNGTYTATISLANHSYNTGKYNAHAYVLGTNQVNSFVKATTFTATLPSVTVAATAASSKQQTFNLSATNLQYKGVTSNVRFAVWSDANGQDDLVWY